MSCTRRDFVSMAAGATLLGLAACTPDVPQAEQQEQATADTEPTPEPEATEPDLKAYEALALDTKAWKYDKENDVYYQLHVPYCLDPESESYESLAIFVPGAYFKAEEHGKTFACEVNMRGKVGKFRPAIAPVAMPINSGTLSPQACPTAYDYAGLESYLKAGFVYVYAGFRGRSSGFESSGKDVFSGGAPWPVVDLKAAVRFLRYNADVLPIDANRIVTFGFSMGGGVSALMGATGDSQLYLPYLDQIGAAMYDAEGNDISDATFASASWCPITSFDSADAAYEWDMGQYDATDTRAEGTWTKLLSGDLANAYATYLNEMGLCDDDGNALTLDQTSNEAYADGTYYTYLLEAVENAATAFLKQTEFPYTYTPHHMVNAYFPGDPGLQSAAAGASDVDTITGDPSTQAAGGVQGDELVAQGTQQVQSVVYNTQADYINALNSDAWWFTYNQQRQTVRIGSLGDFARHHKVAVKPVCAFDAIDRSTVENQLFGIDEASALHFSPMVRDVLVAGRDSYQKLEGWEDGLTQDWTSDLLELDALQTDMETRMQMFNPLFFLCETQKGFGTSTVAAHWRLNSGLFQTDTSLCTEVNLALALRQHADVKDVSFEQVWGKGHELAEATGSAEENLIAWIISCCGE